jgi:hypothetical protein
VGAAGPGLRQRNLERYVGRGTSSTLPRTGVNPSNSILPLHRRESSGRGLPYRAGRNLNGRKAFVSDYKTLVQRATYGAAANNMRQMMESSDSEDWDNYDANSAGGSSQYGGRGGSDDEQVGRGTRFGYRGRGRQQQQQQQQNVPTGIPRSSSAWTLASTGSVRPTRFVDKLFLKQGDPKKTIRVVLVNGWVGVLIWVKETGILGMAIDNTGGIPMAIESAYYLIKSNLAQEEVEHNGTITATVYTANVDKFSIHTAAMEIKKLMPDAIVKHKTYAFKEQERGYWELTGKSSNGKTRSNWIPEVEWKDYQIEGVRFE